jgi:flavin-dependent dehydrogenase
MKSKNRVWLGENNILMLGDAAGLVDQVRGVGMDAAALSGRLAAQAIITAEDNNNNVKALDEYTRLASKIVNQTKANQNREITEFKNNDQLMSYITGSMARSGLGMLYQNIANKFRSVEDFVLMPP